MNFTKNKNLLIGIFGGLTAIGLLIISLVSCDYKKEMVKIEPYIIQASDFNNLLFQNGISNVLLVDRKYYILTEEWIKECYKLFKKEMFDNGELTYVPEALDCDDRASFFITFAKRKYNQGNKIKMPITVGEFIYTTSSGSKHDIVIVLVRDKNNKNKIRFFEVAPEIGRFVELKEAEVLSSEHVRF